MDVKQQRKGILCVFLAAVLYSIGGLCIKLIPWNGMSINGGRTMVALVVIGGYLIVTKHKIRFNRYILLGALCVCGTNILFSVANKMTTAANTIVLQFTAPIFVLVLSMLFWKKKPRKLDVITCILVFVGIVCCFLGDFSVGRMAGNLIAVLTGMAYAGVCMLNVSPRSDSLSSIFFGQILAALIGFPWLISETDFSIQPILCIALLGILQVGGAYIFFSEGLRFTPPVSVSLISAIEPVLNPILVAIFYGEHLGVTAIIGACIVVASVFFYNIRSQTEPNDSEKAETT